MHWISFTCGFFSAIALLIFLWWLGDYLTHREAMDYRWGESHEAYQKRIQSGGGKWGHKREGDK